MRNGIEFIIGMVITQENEEIHLHTSGNTPTQQFKEKKTHKD